MNGCLADLSHLIPSNYLKKGRGRIEKTEIVEMAIKHIKHLHELLPSTGSPSDPSGTPDSNPGGAGTGNDGSSENKGSTWQCPQEVESFKNGYNECLAEAVHFLVEREHIPAENPLCSRLVNHLKRYLDQKGHQNSSSMTSTSTPVATIPNVPPPNAVSGVSSGSTGSSEVPTAAERKRVHHHHSAAAMSSNSEMDSDYCSMRSESSAANSEVGSIVSTQSSSANSAILNNQRKTIFLY